VWAVLTAREHLTRAECRRHLTQLRRGLQRRWPAIEWFVQVEFQRRGALHLNLLIKGVLVDDVDELREDLAARWCARVDAEPVGQWVGPVTEAGGVVRYLQKTLSHGLKQEQAPPLGWRGHRTSQTRGYLVRPAGQLRQEAREALRHKREVWRALKGGLEGHDAELAAHEAVAAAQAATWRLVHLDLRSPAPPPDQRMRTRPTRVSSVGVGSADAAAQAPPSLEPRGGLTPGRRAPASGQEVAPDPSGPGRSVLLLHGAPQKGRWQL
jgi:hypothetical protein